MRAKTVNFERSRDPKEALGIGSPVIQNVVDWLHDESEGMFWEMNFELPYPSKSDVREFVVSNISLMKELSNWEPDWIPEENLMTDDVIQDFREWWFDKNDPE